MSHRIPSQCGPELRPILVLVLVRSCGQGTAHNVALYPMYYGIFFHRID